MRFEPFTAQSVASRVEIDAGTGCWNWLLTKDRDGYGQVTIGRRTRIAHRAVYECLVGPFPEGLEADHTCRNRACVNPAHIEPVTHAENIRRATRAPRSPRSRCAAECRNGHPFTPENTYLAPQGHRVCRTCRHAASLRYRARKKGR